MDQVDDGRTSIIGDALVRVGIAADVEALKRRISFEGDVEEASRDGMLHRLSTLKVSNQID